MLEYVHKEIKKNLKFINNKFLKFKKKIELNDGSCDIDYIEKKKTFHLRLFNIILSIIINLKNL